jgi:hypothetical protein
MKEVDLISDIQQIVRLRRTVYFRGIQDSQQRLWQLLINRNRARSRSPTTWIKCKTILRVRSARPGLERHSYPRSLALLIDVPYS